MSDFFYSNIKLWDGLLRKAVQKVKVKDLGTSLIEKAMLLWKMSISTVRLKLYQTKTNRSLNLNKKTRRNNGRIYD